MRISRRLGQQRSIRRQLAISAYVDKRGELDCLLYQKKRKTTLHRCEKSKSAPTDYSEQHVIQEQGDENNEENQSPRLLFLSEPF